LDASRIISGKLQFNLEPTDLAAVVSAVVEGMRDKSAARGVFLDSEIPVVPVTVNGNRVRLHQIASNLVAIAIQFTGFGGRVRVSLRDEGREARIIVSDTGVGIDPEFLPKVFELFSQAGETGSSKYEGLGLGLAIVKRLTEFQGGWVRAQSGGQGKGATFLVGFPRADRAPFDASTDSSPNQLVVDKTVLIVEDSADFD